MHQTNTKKNFPVLKERKEAFVQWLDEHGWSRDYAWDGEKHVACNCTPRGTWRIMNFGFYLASDWRYRLFAAHRCTKCGIFVQHSQICDEQGFGTGDISRNVFLP